MDQKVLTEHVAVFIPGTFSLQNMDGLNYTVTSDLAVAPIWDPDAYTVAMFNYTGEIDLALLQEIAHLVHVHMVAGIPA
jgi:hypothetical protein